MKKNKIRNILLDFGAFILGGALYAVSLTSFSAANDIAPGGFSGLATIINFLTGMPLGFLIALLNLPLFIFAAWKIGVKFLTKSIAATVILSALVDVFDLFMPRYTGDKILAALWAGVLSGSGLALIFLRGGTTGGTDILAKLVQLRFRFIPLGRLITVLDALIVAGASAVFGNIETALYSAVLMFTAGQVIDKIIYGTERGKLILVISNLCDTITSKILLNLGRGVTLLKARGAHSGENKNVAMCAVRIQETARVHQIIKETDPYAFVIVCEANEILGLGFKGYSEK